MKSFIVSLMALASLVAVNADTGPTQVQEIRQDMASSAFDPLWGAPSQAATSINVVKEIRQDMTSSAFDPLWGAPSQAT
jgi:hypothetical protein